MTECCLCPYHGEEDGCYEKMTDDLLSLINRQKAEIKKLEKVEHFADKTIETQKAEIERLQHEIQYGKAITIGKFAGKLESRLANNTDISAVGFQSVVDDIESVLTEMVGEQ